MAAAIILGLVAVAVAGGFADAPAAQPSPALPAAAASGDAAANHAKRAACLKDAKTKKLVGAAKTSFLKSCIPAPSQARVP